MFGSNNEILNSHFNTGYFPDTNEVTMLTESIPGLSTPQWLGFSYEGKPYKFEFSSSNTGEIFNPYLLRSYELKQSQSGLASIEVYHGTISKNINSIAENNFNWRLSGRSRGYKHGKGVCFSTKEEFVHQFCRGLEKRIIKTKILYGRASIGGQAQLLPGLGYDSTQSPNGNVIVKFQDSEFLPIHVYEYDDTVDDSFDSDDVYDYDYDSLDSDDY